MAEERGFSIGDWVIFNQEPPTIGTVADIRGHDKYYIQITNKEFKTVKQNEIRHLKAHELIDVVNRVQKK